MPIHAMQRVIQRTAAEYNQYCPHSKKESKSFRKVTTQSTQNTDKKQEFKIQPMSKKDIEVQEFAASICRKRKHRPQGDNESPKPLESISNCVQNTEKYTEVAEKIIAEHTQKWQWQQ